MRWGWWYRYSVQVANKYNFEQAFLQINTGDKVVLAAFQKLIALVVETSPVEGDVEVSINDFKHMDNMHNLSWGINLISVYAR